MSLKLKILGIPQPKQSVRSRVVRTKTGKSFVQHYQTSEVKKNERNFSADAKTQIPEGFIPFSGPVKVKALFVFPPLKGFTKAKLNALSSGATIYKTTKPDLTDNLMKGTMDALNGVVFTDDAIIAEVESKKIFGIVPRIELEFEKLD